LHRKISKIIKFFICCCIGYVLNGKFTYGYVNYEYAIYDEYITLHGFFHNNMLSDYGIIGDYRQNRGFVYEGQIKDGLFHGNGTITKKHFHGLAHGYYKCDLRHNYYKDRHRTALELIHGSFDESIDSNVKDNILNTLLSMLSEKYVNDYRDWIHISWILKNIDENNKELWKNWSKRSEKYNATECDNTWNKFTCNDGRYIPIDRLLDICKRENKSAYDNFMTNNYHIVLALKSKYLPRYIQSGTFHKGQIQGEFLSVDRDLHLHIEGNVNNDKIMSGVVTSDTPNDNMSYYQRFVRNVPLKIPVFSKL
jgi:hypothetical protein